MILSILGDVFAIASYYDREKVLLEDIKFAINKCDRIYDSVRERESKKLNIIKNENAKVQKKILEFPKSYS